MKKKKNRVLRNKTTSSLKSKCVQKKGGGKEKKEWSKWIKWKRKEKKKERDACTCVLYLR